MKSLIKPLEPNPSLSNLEVVLDLNGETTYGLEIIIGNEILPVPIPGVSIVITQTSINRLADNSRSVVYYDERTANFDDGIVRLHLIPGVDQVFLQFNGISSGIPGLLIKAISETDSQAKCYTSSAGWVFRTTSFDSDYWRWKELGETGVGGPRVDPEPITYVVNPLSSFVLADDGTDFLLTLS
jgi:hypothetical protein